LSKSGDTYLKSDTLVVFERTHIESLCETSSASSIGDDIVFVAPFLAKNVSEEVGVRYRWNTIVGVVGGHDGGSTAVDDGALEGREIERPQLSLTTVDGGSIDALLRGSKGSLGMSVIEADEGWDRTYVVLHHG
jgi:hypothetical protein